MLYLVANLTPFDSRGKVDLARLRAHVLWLSAHGVDGFVPTGSTGEFLYLTDREREAVHRAVLDAAGAAPVYPCTFDPSPATCAWLTDAAREQGASGVLMPPPLYYHVDDATVVRYYREFAERARLPVLAYHNPKHLQTGISPSLYANLRKIDGIVGIKDSGGDVFRLRRLAASDPGCVWAGGDHVLPEARGIPGIAGFISAAGNVWPSLCVRIWKKGEVQLAEALVERVSRLHEAGGLRAMKALLGMKGRMPLPEADAPRLEGLPSAEPF